MGMTSMRRRGLAAACAAWLVLASAWIAPAAAGEVLFGHVLPGGGAIGKPVVSMKGRRYLDMVPQRTDFSCGAAALATILKYAYGRDVSEHEVIVDLLRIADPEQVRLMGFSLLDIKRYVQSLGMRARGYRLDPILLDRVRVPGIALLDSGGYKHFVVVNRTIGDKVYVADPALGHRVLTRAQFASEWNGLLFVIIGEDFDADSSLIHPPAPLSARGLTDPYRPLDDADLLDFGFGYAELF